jgi:hypothetical protein
MTVIYTVAITTTTATAIAATTITTTTNQPQPPGPALGKIAPWTNNTYGATLFLHRQVLHLTICITCVKVTWKFQEVILTHNLFKLGHWF